MGIPGDAAASPVAVGRLGVALSPLGQQSRGRLGVETAAATIR